MLARVRQLLEMIRFSHTLFALPFALLAAVMAGRPIGRTAAGAAFRWQDLLGILVCMVTARSAAMGFNRLADRRLDALNPRTEARHLPSGHAERGERACCSRSSARSVSWPARCCFCRATCWPLYASVPVLLFLFGYSYAKRFTVLSHFWLGAALMLAPLAAWVAIRAGAGLAPLVLGGAVMLWVAGFDMIYACQDVEFDRRMRLRSVPARLGVGRGAAAGGRRATWAWSRCSLLLPVVYPAFGWIYCGRRGGHRRRCWSTNIGWSGPTT